MEENKKPKKGDIEEDKGPGQTSSKKKEKKPKRDNQRRGTTTPGGFEDTTPLQMPSGISFEDQSTD